MNPPVTWTFEDQAQQVGWVRNRGNRWFWLSDRACPEDLQVGDVAVLWPGAEGEGHGVAALVTHTAFIDGDVYVISIGEPMEARIGGGDGGE